MIDNSTVKKYLEKYLGNWFGQFAIHEGQKLCIDQK